MSQLKFDSDQVIGHLINNTDLLKTFVSGLDGMMSIESQDFLGYCEDEILTDATKIHYEVAYGSYPFHFSVMEHKGVFFINGLELGDFGYFLKKEHAVIKASQLAAEWPIENYQDDDEDEDIEECLNDSVDNISEEQMEAISEKMLGRGLVRCCVPEDNSEFTRHRLEKQKQQKGKV